MASRRTLLRPLRDVAFRSKAQSLRNHVAPVNQTRFASNDQKTSVVPPGSKGPNEDQLPHVSEEQAAMDKSMGNTPPDLSQGTPVQEILSEDKDAQKKAPEVIKEKIKSQDGTGQKRSYSTSARRMAAEAEIEFSANQPEMSFPIIGKNGMIRGLNYPDAGPGHKFPLPKVTDVSRLDHLRRRYDPVVDQVTKSLMRHGKLSIAQKNMDEILTILRTAPAPNPNPAFPQRSLIISDHSAPTTNPSLGLSSNTPATSSHLPRSTLPLHPIEYLTTLIDSVSPIIKIRQQRGIAGGGASLPIPVPLGVRQRRRQAIQWILGAADNRKEIKLSERVAKELLKVADGTSGVWERRAMVHRLGISARSNVRAAMLRRR